MPISKFNIIPAFLLFAGTINAQTVTTAGSVLSGEIITRNNLSISSGTDVTSSVFVRGDGTLTWGSISSGLTSESRKVTGPGPTLAQVRLASRHITPMQLAPESYILLAKSVGARASANEAELLSVLNQLNLTIYDFAKVDDYLMHMAKKQGSDTRWVWKPVTESSINWQQDPRIGVIYPKVYTHSIPIQVLANMKAVLDTLPDAIFLASDYEVIHPDPFLAVTTKELLAANKLWIIDQWDEPGFSKYDGNTVHPVSVTIAKR